MLARNARLLETVDVLEKRLRCNLDEQDYDAEHDGENYNDSDSSELFSPLHRILYTHMLGDCYYQLLTEFGRQYYPSAEVLREFGDRAEAAFRSAVNLAALIALEPTSPLRLLAMCSLCKVLATVRGRHRRARHLALKLFTAATFHSQAMPPESARLLQILRNDFVPILTPQQVDLERARDAARRETYSSDESSDADNDVDDRDQDSDDEGLFDEDGNRLDPDDEPVVAEDGAEEGPEVDAGEREGAGEGKGVQVEGQGRAEERVGAVEAMGEGGGGGGTAPETPGPTCILPAKATAPAAAKAVSTTPARTSTPGGAKSPAAAKTPSKAADKEKPGVTGSAKGSTKKANEDEGDGGKKADKGKGMGSKDKSSKDKGKNTAADAAAAGGKKGPSKPSAKPAAIATLNSDAAGPASNMHLLSKHARSAIAMVKGLRKITSATAAENAGPVLLEPAGGIPSGAEFYRALYRIFSVYVRGAQLPGHAAADYKVTVDGHEVSFAAYLLKGPYMSFRGICVVMRDFGLAKMPDKRKAPGFPAIHDPPGAVKEFRGGARAKALLTIREAVILFIECSRSAHPALTSEAFLPAYKELAVQERASSVSLFKEQLDVAFLPDGSPVLRCGTSPWDRALEWAAAEGDDCWEKISCGLNFMQFLDFLGKAALVAYSSPRFAAVFPSPAKKVDHFLSAQMGLVDSNRWLAKVDSRVLALKYTIEGLQAQALQKESAHKRGKDESK